MPALRDCNLPMGMTTQNDFISHCRKEYNNLPLWICLAFIRERIMGLWNFVKETGSSWFGSKADAATVPTADTLKTEMEKNWSGYQRCPDRGGRRQSCGHG